MKIIKKALKFFIYSALSFFPSKGIVILMYHSVGGNKEFFTVKTEDFDKQMKYLKDKGFNVVKLKDLPSLKNNKNIKKTVAITFDDGYMDNYSEAFPILEKYGFPATIFITTSLIGGKIVARRGTELGVLSEAEIKEMLGSGLIDFGSHCHHHVKLATLNEEGVKEEFSASQKILSEISGASPDILAYPYGNFNDRVLDIAKNFFKIIVTVRKGREKSLNLLNLRRNSIDSEIGFWQFKKIVKLGRL